MAEFAAAQDAYSHPERVYGTQKQPAACVFPARLAVLEQLTGRSFPKVACPDLDDWVSRIGADEVYLVFVGAYSGNPASIFGHTFLRLGRSARTRSGEDLLSYSVGFLAQTAGDDNRLTYMVKGLSGGYPGSYEIEPHYMKVGLYNNSESRDLWELKLRLNPKEVRQLVLHFWELTFNAQIPYYFIDENCSFRLLTMIEAVKPEIHLSSALSLVVLPAETMRAVLESGLAEPVPHFRASILRRLNYKLAKFSSDEGHKFSRDAGEIAALREESNPRVIDALLDYWLYKNYRVQAKLPVAEAQMMDATYLQASKLTMPVSIADQEIESVEGLRAPFEGHRPRWAEASAGVLEARAVANLKFRSGVHPFWSNDPGYQDITAIEYLGIDLQASEAEHVRWQALLINARSFENTFGFGHPLAWSFDVHAGNNCLICDANAVEISGGAGASFRIRPLILYSLLHVETAAWWESGAQAYLAPGLAVGLRVGFGDWSFTLETSRHLWKERIHTEGESRINYALGTNHSLFIKGRASNLEGGRDESEYTLGWTEFFN